jgi:tRNA nucleotidyltransferase/poly(A) polymerase
MNEFQKKAIDILAEHSQVWILGGAVRDKLFGRDYQDIDLASPMQLEKAEIILRENGYKPQKLGRNFATLSLFGEGSRIDIVKVDNLKQDALRRDFTINAIYMNPYSDEIFDPLAGRKDLIDRRLKCCGNPEDRFKEDPVRILRMIKFAVKYEMEIEKETWDEAKDLVAFLVTVPKERVTSELVEILLLEQAEKAVRLLEGIGYWDVFVPELARLKGIVQNQYHALDVWEHTMAVFRNTPQDLFLRLAGLFHDIGKWEVASRECYLAGRLEQTGNDFRINNFKISGTRGSNQLNYQLKPLVGKEVKILGARLDEHPDIVQFKRILRNEQVSRGLSYVENGKRHFLNHEKASSKILAEILPRYSFAMFFEGAGQKREQELLKLVENHMRATLTFMPEFRGEESRRTFKDRAAELVWDVCWDGRNFELQNIHDFVVLWKADFLAGKVHSESQRVLFEQIFRELIIIALWQQENLPKIDWLVFREYAVTQGITGQSLGRFKDFVRAKAMKEGQFKLDSLFLKKAYSEFNQKS